MSTGSEASSQVSVSKVQQFGLYRTIDARTEEFLKLSKRRQLRQGCVCAAVSTFITVTVVVIILLIYEYAIAVENSLVQKLLINNNSNNTYTADDNPKAEKLDRTYFGFDQDYYERMPLLVNAMQENSYNDPMVEMPVTYKNVRRVKVIKHMRPTTIQNRPIQIRRTSPRPFVPDYKNPTPKPFSNSHGSSRSWVETYRNAQRLRNLQQVINYLEKTINAKFGDIYSMPTAQIAFSGVYLQPKDGNLVSSSLDQALESSNNINTVNSNHQRPDPLYKYKPENPGDVNMLAENLLRFSPSTVSMIKSKYNSKIPMFRPISYRTRNCIGTKKCEMNNDKNIFNLLGSGEIKTAESTEATLKPTTFSVMLNLMSLTPTEVPDLSRLDYSGSTSLSPDKIYFTTSKPLIQFRRKSSSTRRNFVPRKFPRLVIKKRKISRGINLNNNYSGEIREAMEKSENTNMIVHVNVFPKIDNVNIDTNVKDHENTQSAQKAPTEITMVNSTQVEDFHVGSSGIIPVDQGTEPSLPILSQVTEMIPFFDTTTSNTVNTWSTTSPDVFKFSHEDAKVPDHYRNLNSYQTEYSFNREDIQSSTISNRRNSRDSVEDQDQDTENEEILDKETETKTLIVKLKNTETTSVKNTIEGTTVEPEITETSTIGTYVPQINGHYRNLNQKAKTAKALSDMEEERERKRRLENSVGGIRKPTYVPMYVEIKRNKTKSIEDEESE